MNTSFAEYTLSAQELDTAKLFGNLYFERTGFFENAFSHRMTRANPDFYMVFVCVGGKGFLTVKNKTFEISTGDIFFTFPDVPHIYASDDKEPWSIYWAHFYAAHPSVPEIFEACGISAGNPVLHIRRFAETADLFRTVFSDLYKCSAAELMYRQSVFVHMLFKIFTLASSQNRKDPYVTKALEYIHGNPDKYISLDILADICGVSKYYLSHMFTEQTGVPVKQYILSLRLSNAKFLLESTEKSITEISQICGYENSMYFSNAFKKYYGLSPKNYRKSVF